MGILDKLLGRSGGQEETVTYRCNTCYTRFETRETDVVVVACDACGSDDVERVEEPA